MTPSASTLNIFQHLWFYLHQLDYVGFGPINSGGTMSTAGQARLQTGLNGPVSGMSQLVRRFAAASMDAPRGSNGARGPQYGGLSIASTSKRHTMRVPHSNNNNAYRLVAKLQQLRNKVTHRKGRKRSPQTHHHLNNDVTTKHQRRTTHTRHNHGVTGKKRSTTRRHIKPLDDKRKLGDKCFA